MVECRQTKKSLPLSWEASRGEGTASLLLLWLLLLWLIRSRAGGSKLLQVVLQEADFDAAPGHALGFGFALGGRRRNRCIAHADQVNPIDRDVVVQRQIADYRLRHLLRVGNRDLSVTGRKALDFDDVATLVLQRGGHVVESALG